MFQLPYMRHLVPLLTVVSIIAVGAYVKETLAQTRVFDQQMPMLSIQGMGEVTTTPDLATFSFSVEEDRKTQEEAQTASAEKVNAIVASLKESGVEEKDIQTSDYSVSPKYKYPDPDPTPKVVRDNIGYPPQDMIQVGYTASQRVTVKVRAIDKAGALLGSVGEKGATNISSLSLTVDDMEKVKNEARALAIEDAKTKAGERAKQLDVRLGRMVSFYENTGYGDDFRIAKGASLSISGNAEQATPEISVGENKYRINVTLNYTFR